MMPSRFMILSVVVGVTALSQTRVLADINLVSATGQLSVSADVRDCTNPQSCTNLCNGCGDQVTRQGMIDINPAHGPASLPLACPGCSVLRDSHTVSAGPVQADASLIQTVLTGQSTIVFQTSASGSAQSDRPPGVTADGVAESVVQFGGSITFDILNQNETVTIEPSLNTSNFASIFVALSRTSPNPADLGVFSRQPSGSVDTLPRSISLPPGRYSIGLDFSGQAVQGLSINDGSRGLFGPTLSFGGTVTVGLQGKPSTEFHWVSAAGGDFGNASNWNPAQVPGSSDTAIFDLPGGGSPVHVVAQNASVGRLLVDPMALELNGSAQVGQSQAGQSGLSVSGGGQLVLDNVVALTSVDGAVGSAAGSLESSVFVSGSGNSWTIGSANPLLVGVASPGKVVVDHDGHLEGQKEIDVGSSTGSGTLRIETGGQVTTPNCTINQGSVQVRGQGAADSKVKIDSTLDVGGQNGSGAVVIETGGTITAQKVLVGDRAASGASTITISGQDSGGLPSALDVSGAAPELHVAGSAGTQIEVKDGGLLTVSRLARIGENLAVGKVLVHGQGAIHSGWDTFGDVFIGGQIVASELVVQDGGHVTVAAANQMVVGSAAGDLGQVTVAGQDALLSTGTLAIGSDGHGELTISGGAKVTTSGQGQMGLSSRVATTSAPPTSGGSGSGVATIQGDLLSPSEWHVAGDCFVGQDEPGAVILLGTVIGPVSVGGATLSVDGTLTVGPNGVINGNGALAAGNRVVNGGIISPGLSPGMITIEGDYEQTADGVLKIEVGGLDAGQFDVLKVSGNATLAGHVDLQFINGFVPKPGDNVDFAQVAGQITGKLSGDTLIDVPASSSAGSGDNTTTQPAATQPATSQPVAQAVVKWEVTPDGTCRMTVTDVTAAGQSALGAPAASACGAGLCGAGVVPMLPTTLIGLLAMRFPLRRFRADRR